MQSYPDLALLSREGSETFYNDRYKGGYMDAWDAQSVARVLEFIEACGLPDGSRLLDFGCGTGEFTSLIQTHYPSFDCVGTDMSSMALSVARAKYHDIKFLDERDIMENTMTFDVVFTHHVLEHVYDLNDTILTISKLVKQDGHMIHILPCGNYGSLEERLCRAMRFGKDPRFGNRFLCDEIGHVRRLRSDELSSAVASYGFELRKSWFGGQFWGSVQWHLCTGTFLSFPSPLQAKGILSFCVLFGYRFLFFSLGLLCAPAGMTTRAGGDPTKWSFRKSMAIRLTRPFVKLSWPFYSLIERLAQREWDNRKTMGNGSSMFLLFHRSSG